MVKLASHGNVGLARPPGGPATALQDESEGEGERADSIIDRRAKPKSEAEAQLERAVFGDLGFHDALRDHEADFGDWGLERRSGSESALSEHGEQAGDMTEVNDADVRSCSLWNKRPISLRRKMLILMVFELNSFSSSISETEPRMKMRCSLARQRRWILIDCPLQKADSKPGMTATTSGFRSLWPAATA
jgi:hypothetical protein